MTSSKIQLGRFGEQEAIKLLLSKGYSIKERNFRSKYGEIDIIALKDATYAFVEVKCRMGDKKGKPYEAVTGSKLHRILRVAEVYVLQNKLKTYKLSVHVISIELDEGMRIESCHHFEDVML